jgi:hypothetical protein
MVLNDAAHNDGAHPGLESIKRYRVNNFRWPTFSEIDLRPVQLIPLLIPSNSGSAMRLRYLPSWRLIRHLDALDVEREGVFFWNKWFWGRSFQISKAYHKQRKSRPNQIV